jgi:WD40 repeat protein
MNTPPVSLEGHTNTVDGIAFHPDGQIIATASQDGSARLWHAPSGQPLAILFQGDAWVTSVAFSPDGRWLACGLESSEAHIWEMQSGLLYRTLKGHQDSILSLAFSPDSRILATGSADSTARLWAVDTGRTLGVLTSHTDAVAVVAFSQQQTKALGLSSFHTLTPETLLLATGSYDASVRVWSIFTEP